jgi:hypothetical protein
MLMRYRNFDTGIPVMTNPPFPGGRAKIIIFRAWWIEDWELACLRKHKITTPSLNSDDCCRNMVGFPYYEVLEQIIRRSRYWPVAKAILDWRVSMFGSQQYIMMLSAAASLRDQTACV